MIISVLLPISNNEPASYQAINSILNQTYKNYEILICLNGNNKKFDDKIIDHYKKIKKIKFFKIKERNIVPALNHLILKAKGKFCARMDADDLCKPERFEEQINFIKKKNIDFLSSNCEVNENGKLSYIHKTNLSKSIFTNPIVHPTIMIKTKIIKSFKYKNIPFAEDYELYQRLYKNGVRLKNIDKELIIYNHNIKNIKNKERAFYQILSTIIIAKAFQENNSVNENFFSKVKISREFKKHYVIYLKYYILNKNVSKYFFLLFFLILMFLSNSFYTCFQQKKKNLKSRFINFVLIYFML